MSRQKFACSDSGQPVWIAPTQDEGASALFYPYNADPEPAFGFSVVWLPGSDAKYPEPAPETYEASARAAFYSYVAAINRRIEEPESRLPDPATATHFAGMGWFLPIPVHNADPSWAYQYRLSAAAILDYDPAAVPTPGRSKTALIAYRPSATSELVNLDPIATGPGFWGRVAAALEADSGVAPPPVHGRDPYIFATPYGDNCFEVGWARGFRVYISPTPGPDSFDWAADTPECLPVWGVK